MEGHFLEVPGYSVPGTSYSVPSTNYEVPPTQSVVPATNYEAPGSIMAAMPPGMGGMGGYSAPSTRYDVPGSNDRTVMTYAAPLQSAELTPASTFATTFSSTTNEVPFMKYAAPMDPLHSYGSPVSSFQPPATPEPISTGAFLATHPELATLDGTARALSTPEPLAGYSTPLATTPARCSETPTTLVGATPLIPGFVADAPRMICLTIFFSLILLGYIVSTYHSILLGTGCIFLFSLSIIFHFSAGKSTKQVGIYRVNNPSLFSSYLVMNPC
jgi:hypothetical protein